MWIVISIQFLFVGRALTRTRRHTYGYDDDDGRVQSRAAKCEGIHGDAVIWMVGHLGTFLLINYEGPRGSSPPRTEGYLSFTWPDGFSAPPWAPCRLRERGRKKKHTRSGMDLVLVRLCAATLTAPIRLDHRYGAPRRP